MTCGWSIAYRIAGGVLGVRVDPKGRFGAFRPIYTQLSEMAHHASRSILSSSRISVNGRYEWSSTASFKTESDALIACGWVVELAGATSHLLVDFGESDVGTSSHPFAQRR